MAISREEERASASTRGEGLVLRYLAEQSEELRTQILAHYSGLVQRTARKFAGSEPVEDLAQVGFIGLMNALKKFDPAAGVRFTTYATYLVAGEIKHYLRDRSQTIRHPAWLQELRHKVNRATSYLHQSLGRVPTPAEVAYHIGVQESVVREVISTQDMLRVSSLDAVAIGEEDADTELERLDSAAFCVDQLTVEDRLVLESALSQLRDLEREVLVLFHFHSLKQTEIAAKLGISGNYVTHILRQSLAKLRRILTAENERDRVLRRQASAVNYDVLEASTGAYTEAFFRARIAEEIHRASSNESAVGVVLVHFVGLSSLAAFYGDASISAFLADATTFIRENVRRLDLVCRFGPHGFGIILPATGHNAIVARDRLVHKLTEWTGQRFQLNSPVSVELGHASYPENGKSVAAVLRCASVQTVLKAA